MDNNLGEQLKDQTEKATSPSNEATEETNDFVDKITNKIFLGDYGGSLEKEFLKKMNVTNILNLSDFNSEYSDDFIYKHIEIADMVTANIMKFFGEAINFIESSAGNVYVHCSAGISRSPSIVIAYLMWKDKLSFLQAHGIVKRGRRMIRPNMSFEKQLKHFELLLLEKNYNLEAIDFENFEFSWGKSLKLDAYGNIIS